MTCKGCEFIQKCRETGAELQTCKRYKPRTNFDRITDSPEALAGFICANMDCVYCVGYGGCDGNKDTLVEWLKEIHK